MRGLFLIYEDIMNDSIGINKKILSQIENFRENGMDVQSYLLQRKIPKLYKILYRLPFTNLTPVWKFDDVFTQVDFIYFRRPFCMSSNMRKVLKKIKQIKPDVKIILEIPTYPYDMEILDRYVNIPLFIKDCFNRKRLSGIVDKIATLTNDKEIWGIKTIKIRNGIDLSKHKIREYTDEKIVIHIIVVAVFAPWHGYERLIIGMENYVKTNPKRKIIVHMVGEGSELPYYKKLVDKKHLGEYFIFYGFLHSEMLADVYNKCDLAVTSLGCYKMGLELLAALKSREYLAKGMPIISGCRLDVFEDEKDYEFLLNFPNNPSPIDMYQVVNFYDRVYGNRSKKEVVSSIRKFAEQKVGMREAMKEIVRYLKE